VIVLVSDLGSADDLSIFLLPLLLVVEVEVVVNHVSIKVLSESHRNLGAHLDLELLIGSSVRGDVEGTKDFLSSHEIVGRVAKANTGIECSGSVQDNISIDGVNSSDLSDEISVSVSGRTEVLVNPLAWKLNEVIAPHRGVNSSTVHELVGAEPVGIEVGLGEFDLSEALGEVVASVRTTLVKSVKAVVALLLEEFGAIIRVSGNIVRRHGIVDALHGTIGSVDSTVELLALVVVDHGLVEVSPVVSTEVGGVIDLDNTGDGMVIVGVVELLSVLNVLVNVGGVGEDISGNIELHEHTQHVG